MARVFATVVAIIALVSVAMFVSHHGWIPVSGAQHGRLLDEHFGQMFAEAAVAFVAAQLLLAVIVWRSAGKSQLTSTFPGGSRLTITLGVIFLAFELFAAGTVGRRAWAAMYLTEPPADALTVQVMSEQFAFYFRYPGADGKLGAIHPAKIDDESGNFFGIDTQNDPESKDDIMTASLALPVNHPVELVLLAKDVTHGFYVRELRIQQDMVPGMQIPIHFTPTKIGRYEIVCNQLCGLGHYRMRAYLDVMSQENFSDWLRARAAQQ
jgi:cytochrome c oxidase subunit 2